MEQTLSEIRLFPFNFAPKGWARCDGQVIAVNQNQSLFSLLGYTYGGSGDRFQLPDLRGRVLLHSGNGYQVSKGGGEAAHVLTVKELATHKHIVVASSKPADEPTPKHNFWSRDKPYRTDFNTPLYKEALGMTGGDKPHNNMAPYLSLNYCIALTGVFPSQSVPGDYVGMIKPYPMLKPFTHPWKACDGQELKISDYPKIYSIIRNTYGGDGRITFRLPDLRGRVTLNHGKGEGLSRYELGETGGADKVALTETQLPAHTHQANGKIRGDGPHANASSVWANGTPDIPGFATEPGTSPVMNPGALDNAGEGAAHNNLMPYQVMMFIISIDGEYAPHN